MRPDVARRPSPRHAAACLGSEFSRCDVLQDRVVQGLVGDELLEPGILLLQLLQALGLVDPHPAVFLPPAVVALRRHTDRPAHPGHLLTLLDQDLCLTQLVDDLFRTVALALHPLSLPPSQPRIVTFGLDRNYGERSNMPMNRTLNSCVQTTAVSFRH